jgi:hypothetical protein
MYSTCLFCHHALGGNDQIEAFPVGRRLAFDAAKGRLWVVCSSCGRWNLAPLDERWEAIEQCERRFRGTRIRVSTDNIGLAKLRDGTELVRVGEPLRPEFAAWRYTDQIARRRRRNLMIAGAGCLGTVAVGAGLVAAGVGGVAMQTVQWTLVALRKRRDKRVVFRTTRDSGLFELTAGALDRVVITVGGETTGGSPLHLALQRDPKASGPAPPLFVFEDADLQSVASLALARHNRTTGSATHIRDAVDLLERRGNPFVEGDGSATWRSNFLHIGETASAYPSRGRKVVPLKGAEPSLRLALEMAAHEEQERLFLSVHLSVLEHAWKEAEEIAAIADDLLLPDWIRQRIPG